MNLATVGIVFQAEFLRKISSRPFVIGTVLGMIGIVAFTLLPVLLNKSFASDDRKVVLIGAPAITRAATGVLKSDFDVVASSPTIAQTPSNAYLDAHRKASAVVLLVRDAKGLHGTAYARDPGGWRHETFARDLARLNVALATGLPVARIVALLHVPVTVHSLDARFSDEASASAARGVATLFVTLLYISILLNAQGVMASVAEEKTSRIAELLVATVSPAQLLAGKIFAAGVAGAIQLALWAAAGIFTGQALVGVFVDPSVSAPTAPIFGAIPISSGQAVAFVLFFLVGFIQYATLYAAAASLINRTEDLGSVTLPVVIPVIGGFLIAQFALTQPNAQSVQIFSQIPLLAPFVMFTRIAIATIPSWQIVLSLAINIVATVVIVWAAGKVYRVGLLMYGRLPSPRQILATLRS
jgi:ABC-2 type transport system permease protein